MKALAALIIFAGLLASAAAFSCYSCTTITDKDCDDPYTPSSDHLKNCTAKYRDDGACHKSKAEVEVDGTTYTVVLRGCQRIDRGNTTCDEKDKYLQPLGIGQYAQGWSCNCYGDKCNSGVQATATSLLFAVAVGALAIY